MFIAKVLRVLGQAQACAEVGTAAMIFAPAAVRGFDLAATKSVKAGAAAMVIAVLSLLTIEPQTARLIAVACHAGLVTAASGHALRLLLETERNTASVLLTVSRTI
jgi:hypothetical protein